MIELIPFGYVDDVETVEKEKEKKPYNFSLTVEENFYEAGERYICILMSKPEDEIKILPDPFSVILTKPSHFVRGDELRFFIVDYDTIFGTRYKKIKNYNPRFFNCEERVFFESLLIKYRGAGYKEFEWGKNKIGYELGIARKKRDTIITKFKELGIIKTAINRRVSDAKTQRNKKSYYFDLDPNKILDLLPEIFSKFDYQEVEHDIRSYLRPALEDKAETK